MEIINIIALTMGVAWASGINLYAAVLVLGLMGLGGYIELPPQLHVLMDPLVLIAAGFMYCVEFVADKTPGVDTGWDALHTFIRIPAGAALAAAAVGDVSMPMQLAAFLVGGGIAGTAHLTKASTRVLINTSPEPVSNIAASITEDVLVVGGLWTALQYPWLFLGLLIVFLLLIAWLLPKLLRGVAAIARRIAALFGASPAVVEHRDRPDAQMKEHQTSDLPTSKTASAAADDKIPRQDTAAARSPESPATGH